MTELEVFRKKERRVKDLLFVERRCAVVAPARLRWLVEVLRGRSVEKIPTGYCRDLGSAVPRDVLARTYCLLEEIEAWLTRVDAGMLRHQAEMAKQSANKIARLNMAVEFFVGKS